MPYKTSFFRKIVILVFLLLIPVIIIYSYSYHNNVFVVESEIKQSNMRQLNFFLSQVENHVAQLTLQSVTLSNENGIRELMHLHEKKSFVDVLMTKKKIEEKLSLYSTSNPWRNDIAVYSPISGETVSTYPTIDYTMPELKEEWITRWTYWPNQDSGEGSRFVWYTVDPPATRQQIRSANLIVEVSFPAENIVNMLDQFMTVRQGNPFFYAPEYGTILSRKNNRDKVAELVAILRTRQLDKASNHERVALSGEEYLVSYVHSAGLGWYLVDFVPLHEILYPIHRNRNFFYIVILVLLITGIAVSFAIYRNVQIPIRELINNVQKLKRGDYSARLSAKPKNEFLFLFARFNEMAEQIQTLIENVYAEKIRSREATVKQLQSQINPHFLYNCLFFIASMSRLGENKAVEAMATNLGEYYRYTTRVENQISTVREELGLVRNYLTIINLRQQTEYEIRIPEDMLDLPVPRLLLQPLVENAIIHGIEPSGRKGHIVIYGMQTEDTVQLTVEDNGVGMDEQKLKELQKKCGDPLTEETGCGLWNVNQRLIYIYGDNSGLSLSRSGMGGLKVVLTWRKDVKQNV